MANGKKVVNYTGSLATISVPTSADNVLIREIASSAFTSAIKTVKIDTYKDDISGAPWGAKSVLWLKEPMCTISFDANGGSGTMTPVKANIGIAFALPECTFDPPAGYEFQAWFVGESIIEAGDTAVFTKDSTIRAKWKTTTAQWANNAKATEADATDEGWALRDVSTGYYVSGYTKSVDMGSTYNVPTTIAGRSVLTVYGMSSKSFVYFGGKQTPDINTRCFQGCSQLLEVSFPECTLVHEYAFYDCEKLSSVYLPKMVSIWGQGIFDGCVALQEISFPACRDVGTQAFYGCTSLSHVSLPSCTQLSMQAFVGCTALTSINLPSCVTVGDNAFSSCTNLTTVSLPNVQTLGYGIFNKTKVSNWDGVNPTKFSQLNRALVDKSTNTIVNYISSATYTSEISFPGISNVGTSAFKFIWFSTSTVLLPDCVSVASDAFYGVKNLSAIDVPKCTYVGSNAFRTNNVYINLYIGSQNGGVVPTATGDPVYVYGIRNIYVPSSMVDAYKVAPYWSNWASKIVADNR